ncbi:MAG: SRPBCC domain-containing protein [Pricia sp.]
MKIDGSYKLEATPKDFLDLIQDPETVKKVTPGIKDLEETGPNRYDIVSEVRVGPVNGRFKGKLAVDPNEEDGTCVLQVDQKGDMGNVIAEIDMKLLAVSETEIIAKYKGEAKVSGKLASMGQRIMSGVVSTLSKRFFKDMEKELQARKQ